MIFNMVGGGGGSSTKSTIIVSIETGSTVAAYSDSSYQTLVKTASEKSTGEYWMTGLANGTYYLKATKGTDEATLAYTISEYGVYRIGMAYSTYLFENGNQFTDITGGWTSSGYSYSGHGNKNGGTVGQTLSVSSASGSSANNYGILGTANGIILDNIDAIDVSATIENYRGESRYCVILTTTKSITDSNHVADIAFTSSGTKTIDVSNLSKSTQYYISVVSYVTSATGTYTSNFNVSSIIGRF